MWLWGIPIHQPPPCHTSSLPQLPLSTPSNSLYECFLFNSLVVGLPFSSVFWQFLFFVFQLVAILLLVVWGSKTYLPTPPSWPDLLSISYWVVCFPIFKFEVCLVFFYFGYKSFIRYVFCKDFSPSLVCLFILLTINIFHRAQVFSFNEIQLINFSFMDCAFDVVSFLNLRSPKFSILLPSISFIVLLYSFTLRSMIHFNFCERCNITV